MRAREAMIAFNVGGPVKVGPWPDRTGWSRGLLFTIGACMTETQQARRWETIARLFVDFQTVAVNHGVPLADVHREFLKIDEYRWHISLDSDGAEEQPAGWEAALNGTAEPEDKAA